MTTNEISVNKSSKIEVLGWISLSIISSTSLILLLKQVGNQLAGKYITTLSTLHFFTTWFALQILYLNRQIKKTTNFPVTNKLILASLVVTSIVTMNFNLKSNSVGFYQMSKLVCIPYMLIFNYLSKNQTYPFNIILSLVILLTGVGLFSVSDVEVNLIGTIYAIIAVASTAHNQMLTGEYQSIYHINGPELQFAIVPYQCVIGVLFSVPLEFFGEGNIFDNYYTSKSIIAALGTCFFSIGVNIATFGLIGKTSSITYQVVGHFKTILLLVAGYILFPSQWEDKMKMYRAFVGIVIALIGVFWYTYLKLYSPKDIQPSNDELKVGDHSPLLKSNLEEEDSLK